LRIFGGTERAGETHTHTHTYIQRKPPSLMLICVSFRAPSLTSGGTGREREREKDTHKITHTFLSLCLLRTSFFLSVLVSPFLSALHAPPSPPPTLSLSYSWTQDWKQVVSSLRPNIRLVQGIDSRLRKASSTISVESPETAENLATCVCGSAYLLGVAHR